MKERILITGGCGFIGSALIRYLLDNTNHEILNIDNLTYASQMDRLEGYVNVDQYSHELVDITDCEKLASSFNNFEPTKIMHLAAESHVDNSISDPISFIKTNVFGTFNLLDVTKKFLSLSQPKNKENFRFLHVSTDEVYGDLDQTEPSFTEKSNYRPSSPYSASKAASDHLVNAWFRTYKIPTIITNCSNNYGIFQHEEKLIPLVIKYALKLQSIPIYGDGSQIRDWLHVDDHVSALWTILRKGEVGETYAIGSRNERSNLELVKLICNELDIKRPISNVDHTSKIKSYSELITFVDDRPGHDRRYSINPSKLERDLNWKYEKSFSSSLSAMITWYINYYIANKEIAR